MYFFEGNYQEYEANKRERLGEEGRAAAPPAVSSADAALMLGTLLGRAFMAAARGAATIAVNVAVAELRKPETQAFVLLQSGPAIAAYIKFHRDPRTCSSWRVGSPVPSSCTATISSFSSMPE